IPTKIGFNPFFEAVKSVSVENSMPPAKPALVSGPNAATLENHSLRRVAASAAAPAILRPQHHTGTPAIRPVPNVRRAEPARQKAQAFQTRVPVITGAAVFRGSMSVDGMILGQMDGNGSAATLKQRSKSSGEPELTGELSFKDMLRINGHVARKEYSPLRTFISPAP